MIRQQRKVPKPEADVPVRPSYQCANLRAEIDQVVWGIQAMNHKLNTYGVSIVERPKIKATKKLDLGGEQGKQIVYSETKLALRTHKKTFQKLADM
ncbi:hypothetical protein [Pseudomonas sp. UBA6323]